MKEINQIMKEMKKIMKEIKKILKINKFRSWKLWKKIKIQMIARVMIIHCKLMSLREAQAMEEETRKAVKARERLRIAV